VPAQEPYQQQDFAHLPLREGCIAAYIDRLPEGSAIDTKTLAKERPLYGQQAVRTALRNLSEVGHLRRIREVEGSTGTRRWVQRTYFSSVARDDAWWTAYLADGAPQEPPAPPRQLPPDEPETPVAEPESEPVAEEFDDEVGPVPASPEAAEESPAYRALVALGGVEPRLTLSAAECRTLEGLAAEWFARGTSVHQFMLTLTAGLPQVVHSAGALTRNRLIQKMPPELSLPWQPRPELQLPVRELTMECTDCGRSGRAAALPGGLCADCRDEPSAQSVRARPLADELRARVAGLRSALRPGTGGGAVAAAGG
jgi:hypothetical protein